jgi:hypothetical protein
MKQRKKLIEVALPLPEVNDASAYDKMPGIGAHPKGIHHWWARLPLPVRLRPLPTMPWCRPGRRLRGWHGKAVWHTLRRHYCLEEMKYDN